MWAVPKGPSLNPADKRLAARTEDHPLEYLTFEKVIPAGNYGAGAMIVWDSGTFECEGEATPFELLERGELKLVFHGKRLAGAFVLVKTKGQADKKSKSEDWLLIKHRDAAVDTDWNIEEYPASIVSGRTIEELRDGLPPDRGEGDDAATLEGLCRRTFRRCWPRRSKSPSPILTGCLSSSGMVFGRRPASTATESV